jgi:hypothetical protein
MPSTEPVHLLVDSTGLRLCGPGEWLIEKHGARTRRSWRKLHLGVDADTGEIIATTLTSHDVDDGSPVAPLLDRVDGPVASFAAIIVPPRSNAVPSSAAETVPNQRDRHLQFIAKHGRMNWQKSSGYKDRALVEATSAATSG